MNLFHIGSELRRFAKGKLPPAAFVVLVFLPLIFGGLFPWAYWDPITGLKDLPVALVNSDEGADVNGQHINAGDSITEKLVSNPAIGFEEVTAREAADGVADGTYYFALELPKDFSQAVTSVNTEQPHTAQIATVYNNTNGFIATMLGNQATLRVIDAVDAELGKAATNQLLVGFNTMGAGLNQASEGAGELKEGIGMARDGSEKLADGSSELAGGSAELSDGAQQLVTGAQQLDTGIKTAADGANELSSGLGELESATTQLGDGASQISAGVDQVVIAAQSATATQEELVAPLITASAQLRALGVPPAIDLANQFDATIATLNAQGLGPESATAQNLGKLQDGARTLAFQLDDPTSPYRQGIAQASTGSVQLASGLAQLSDGSGKLVVGTQTLTAGTTELVDGAQQLSVGSAALRDGLVRLDEGSGTLSLKLSEGAAQAPEFGDDKRDAASSVLSQMVTTREAGQQLTTFGVGLTPFFASLSMFLGGLTMFMVLRPLKRRAIDSGMHPFRVAISSWLPGIVIGTLQATAVWSVLQLALGVNAEHPFGFWIALVGVSMTFVAMTQAINALFGPAAGRLFCIVLMALQLVSSGGLYPPETQPAPLRWFHTYDPITYSVNVFRYALVEPGSVWDERLIQSVIVLCCVFAGSLLVTTLSAWRDRLLTQDTLHPELAM